MNTDQSLIYPQSWYPLLPSTLLAKNSSQVVKALGKEWLVLRDNKNNVGIVSRYCSHMGADLSNGKMADGHIECALHGWKFDRNGECRHIPALKSKHSEALAGKNLPSLPCKEAYGLIFVFLGESPAFEIPVPPRMTSIISGNCSIYTLLTEHHAPCLNTFDIQHYHQIHHRRVLGTPELESNNRYHLGIYMNTEVLPVSILDKLMKWLVKGNAGITIDCWGASILMMNNSKTGYGAVIAMLPVEAMKSSVFVVPVKNSPQSRNLLTRLRDKLALRVTSHLIRAFLLPDNRVLAGMKAVEGKLLDGIDDTAKTYWKYFNALPRYSVDSCEKKAG